MLETADSAYDTDIGLLTASWDLGALILTSDSICSILDYQ